jgi:hypothetical protein
MSLRRCVLSSTAIAAVLSHPRLLLPRRAAFDIPSQSAVKAIPELARQAQVQIIAAARDLPR